MLGTKLSANHPSRTRAGKTNAFGNIYKLEIFDDEDETLKASVKRLQMIEGISSLLSITGLIFSFFLIDADKLDIDLSDELSLVVLNSTSSTDLTGLQSSNDPFENSFLQIDNAFDDVCSKDYTPKVAQSKLGWGEVKAYSTSIATKTHGAINGRLLLQIVLALSAYFQGKRWVNYQMQASLTYPTTPSYDRWLEYALTSPLQIFIIASSFNIENFATLLVLGAAQLALVLTGFTHEMLLDDMYELKIIQYLTDSGNNENNFFLKMRARRQNKQFLFTNLFMAWIVFAAIWYVIIDRLRRQILYWCSCSDCSQMPVSWIITIVAVECLLFASFGFVQNYQFIYVNLKNLNASSFNEMKESLVNADEGKKSESSLILDKNKMWIQFSIYYAILSVTSKLLLEVLLIFLLRYNE